MDDDVMLAARLERLASWSTALRKSERALLLEAAERLVELAGAADAPVADNGRAPVIVLRPAADSVREIHPSRHSVHAR